MMVLLVRADDCWTRAGNIHPVSRLGVPLTVEDAMRTNPLSALILAATLALTTVPALSQETQSAAPTASDADPDEDFDWGLLGLIGLLGLAGLIAAGGMTQ
jgi:hypothetical protein